MSLVSKFSILFLAKALTSFKKSNHLDFKTSSRSLKRFLLYIIVRLFVSKFMLTFFPGTKSNSKNLASFTELVISADSFPTVTLGNLPLILLKSSFAIVSRFIILIFILIAACYKNWHGRFIIFKIRFCLIKCVIYSRIPIFEYSHHSNSKQCSTN